LSSLFLFAVLTNLALAAEPKNPVRLGAILPLSGEIAYVGLAFRQGIELALSEHPDFAVIFEDDQSGNRVKAVSAAKKLNDIDQVTILLSAYLSTLPILTPVFKQSGTPLLVLWDSNEKIQTLGAHVFGFGYANELAGADMAAFAKKSLRTERAAVFSFHDEWSEEMAGLFSSQFENVGGQIVLQESLSPATRDFRTLLIRAKDLQAGAIYAPLFASGLQAFIKQAAEVKYKGVLLTADALGESDLTLIGPAANGVYATQIWLKDPAFLSKYQNKFGSTSKSAVNLGYVALGYDAVSCLAQIKAHLEEQKLAPSRSNFALSLPGFRCRGVLGENVLGPNGVSSRREKILKVENGAFKPLE
jgi:branched-chain amino acid transport system substrate-binding protein